MRAYARKLGHRAWAAHNRVRLAGLTTIAALLLMGVFAGAAQASSVSNVTVDNTSPSAAAGAQTTYTVGFTTSSTGTLTGPSGTITIAFPSGTDLSAVSSSSVVDVTNANKQVGGN